MNSPLSYQTLLPLELPLRDGWRPRASISPEDWNTHHPTIKRLYLDEGRQLKDVMHIMESDFGFTATKKMYKTKIAQWKLHKNYKAAEKRDLARIVKTYGEEGRDLSTLLIRGRPVRLDRVQRFLKQEMITDRIRDYNDSVVASPLCLNMATRVRNLLTKVRSAQNSLMNLRSGWSSVIDSFTADSIHADQWKSTPPESSLLPFSTLMLSLVSFVLREAQILLDEINFVTLVSCTFAHSRSGQFELLHAQQLGIKYSDGLRMLEQNCSDMAWQLMNEACAMVHQMISHHNPDLLGFILIYFSDTRFEKFPELKQHLLHYVINMSQTVLGNDHPLSIICSTPETWTRL